MPAFARDSPTETLNQRLQQRRLDLSASVEQVAAWAGIDAERLQRIEAGESIGSSELQAICRALAVDSGAFLHGDDRSPRRSLARFKSASWVDPKPGDFRTLALAAELGRVGGFLAPLLDHANRLPSLREPLPVEAHSAPWQQGYRLGEKARVALAGQSGPIRDLERLLVDAGVHIARVEFSSPSLDAASLWESEALPVILMNERSPRVDSSLSRRALLAHELCHLLHDSGERDLTTQLSWSEGGNYSEDVERRARAFAPAFLAPRHEVKSFFTSGEGRRVQDPSRQVEALARRWGFSLEGAVWHAKNCQIISPSDADRLVDETRPQDHEWKDDFEKDTGRSAGTADSERSSIAEGLLSRLVADASVRGLISEGRGREIVTWS